jgi:hypothetical protein
VGEAERVEVQALRAVEHVLQDVVGCVAGRRAWGRWPAMARVRRSGRSQRARRAEPGALPCTVSSRFLGSSQWGADSSSSRRPDARRLRAVLPLIRPVPRGRGGLHRARSARPGLSGPGRAAEPGEETQAERIPLGVSATYRPVHMRIASPPMLRGPGERAAVAVRRRMRRC